MLLDNSMVAISLVVVFAVAAAEPFYRCCCISCIICVGIVVVVVGVAHVVAVQEFVVASAP